MSEPVSIAPDCGQCGHPFRPHIAIAIHEDPREGGLIMCQETDCPCQATWAAEGFPRPDLTPFGGLTEVRRAIQRDISRKALREALDVAGADLAAELRRRLEAIPPEAVETEDERTAAGVMRAAVRALDDQARE